VGLVSAIFSSLTVVVTYLSAYELTKRKTLAILSSLSLAFTYSFWLYAEVVEVFALNSFFISVLLFLTIKYTLYKEKLFLYLISFVIGLSLTNNQSVIILFPIVAFCIFITNWRIFFEIKTIIKAFIYLILGLIPYLYIPSAAQKYPDMNWGFAVNPENFWYLVSRQYYGWGNGLITLKERFIPENIDSRLDTYINYWKSYVHPLIPLLIPFGIVQMLKNKKFKILLLLTGSFLLAGPFFLVYGGTDFKSFLALAIIERFLISNLLILFLILPFGIIFFEEFISKLPIGATTKRILKVTIISVSFLIPLISFTVNVKRTNLSNVYIGDNVAIDMLSDLPQNSVLMLRNDTLAFNAIYYQNAYNFRSDVKIPGMHNGFRTNLVAIGKSEDEISAHILKNKGGINKKIFDDSIISLLDGGHNVYIDGIYDIDTKDENNKIVTVPFGLLYKFEYQKGLPYPKEEYLKKVNQITNSYHLNDFYQHEEVLLFSLIFADIKKLYSADFFRISEFIHKQYQDDSAFGYLIKSVQLDPLNLLNNDNQDE